MGEMDEAVEKLQKARSLNSEEKAIQVELDKALQKRKATLDKEKKMYRRMMEGGKPTRQSKGEKSSQDSAWVSEVCVCTHMCMHAAIWVNL